MTERMGQEPLLTEREVLEGMSSDQIVDLILQNGERVTAIERSMSLAAEVLEGAYGRTVEQVLKEREKQNGTT